MRLVEIELTGFRRFEETTRINVNGSVVCFVGPNEAGKSSILTR